MAILSSLCTIYEYSMEWITVAWMFYAIVMPTIATVIVLDVLYWMYRFVLYFSIVLDSIVFSIVLDVQTITVAIVGG